MLRLTLAAVALVAVAHPAVAQPNSAKDWRADPGLKHVPTDSFLFASVKVSKLWDNPAAKPFREWMAEPKADLFLDLFGVPAGDIARITVFAPTHVAVERGAAAVVVTTAKPYDRNEVFKRLERQHPNHARQYHSYRVVEGYGHSRWTAFVDDRTLLFLPEKADAVAVPLVAQLLNRQAEGVLAAALAEAADHDVTLAVIVPHLVPLFARRPGQDDPLKPYTPLLKAMTATLTVDFAKTAVGTLTFAFQKPEDATAAKPTLEAGIKVLTEALAGAGAGGQNEFKKWAAATAVTVLKGVQVRVDGAKLIATGEASYADEGAKLVATLTKSLRNDKDRMSASNHMKQLALAMHGYHHASGNLPGELRAAGETAAWSWRVRITPYVDDSNLSGKLDWKKSWDDPANLKVLEGAEMPKVFEHPGRPAPKGHTYFRIFSLPKGAKGTDLPLFEEGKRGPKLTDVTDGTANTLMIVEADEAVPWYKPDVLAYDGKLPLPQLGDKDADLFLALNQA